jgi:hypothetical protein
MQLGTVLERLKQRGSAPTGGERVSDLKQINLFVIPFLGVCAAGVVWHFGFTRETGVALLWALASLTAGGGIGFLFGIPRSSAVTRPTPAPAEGGTPKAPVAGVETESLRPNTNLEEVSDWLTKIIVGLGLVNLGEIGPGLATISAKVAAGWPSLPVGQGQSIASAIIVTFAVSGFLASYVYTRLFLQGAIGRADKDLGAIGRTDEALASLPQAVADPDLPAALTAQELRVAERIQQATRAEDLPAMVEKMRSLAREYEQIRQTDESSPERTQKMANIVQKMRGLALATMPALPDFMRSSSPGERLAAVAMLQTRFDPAHTLWLAERLVEERPFIGFNAASALMSASKNLAGESLHQLFESVQAAQARLAELGLKESGRDGMIERILAQADAKQAVAAPGS